MGIRDVVHICLRGPPPLRPPRVCPDPLQGPYRSPPVTRLGDGTNRPRGPPVSPSTTGGLGVGFPGVGSSIGTTVRLPVLGPRPIPRHRQGDTLQRLRGWEGREGDLTPVGFQRRTGGRVTPVTLSPFVGGGSSPRPNERGNSFGDVGVTCRGRWYWFFGTDDRVRTRPSPSPNGYQGGPQPPSRVRSPAEVLRVVSRLPTPGSM